MKLRTRLYTVRWRDRGLQISKITKRKQTVPGERQSDRQKGVTKELLAL